MKKFIFTCYLIIFVLSSIYAKPSQAATWYDKAPKSGQLYPVESSAQQSLDSFQSVNTDTLTNSILDDNDTKSDLVSNITSEGSAGKIQLYSGLWWLIGLIGILTLLGAVFFYKKFYLNKRILTKK